MYLLLLILCLPLVWFKPEFVIVVGCLTYLISREFNKREEHTNGQIESLKKELSDTKNQLNERIDNVRTSVTGAKLGNLIGGR